MQAILASEQAAFNELYLRHRVLLRKIIGQVLLSDGDVEETVQDVFMEIWNRAANFNPKKGKALGWMICMARRRAVDRLRRVRRAVEFRARLQESVENGAPLVAAESSEAGRESHLTTRDLRRALAGVIESLPCEQRTVIDYVFFKELSQRQIAAQTGIPLGTIKTRLELAIRKLSVRSEHLRGELGQFV